MSTAKPTTTSTKKPTPKATPKVIPKPTVKPSPKPTVKVTPKVSSKVSTTKSTSDPKPGFQPTISTIQLPGVNRGASPDEAKSWFKFLKTNNPALYNELARNLTKLGIPEKKWQSAWNDAVDWTQSLGSNASSDPRDYFSQMSPSDYASPAAASKYGTNVSNTKTTTQYSASGAGADINKTMKSELGREASAAETAAYLKSVNAKAKLEPSSYNTTSTNKAGTATPVGGSGAGAADITNTTATQTTGFDPTLFAQNFARSMPDYAESFAAKDFLKIIDGLIGPDRTAIGKVI